MANSQVKSSSGLYRGRFAPSPSGPLHAGSLIAALASYLDAKANHGLWYVRMEDLDPPRESPQAAADILFSLDRLGLHWDGEVMYQSSRSHAYDQAIEALSTAGLIFPCNCSRQSIRANDGVYPGTCRDLILDNLDPTQKSGPYALRCRTDATTFNFNDLFQGRQLQHLENYGDFVIKRKDGYYAYQLAVVVDDAEQNITHVIRGIDLLDSSARQSYLQQRLGFPQLIYGHIPVIVNQQGQKLSKQHFAQALDLRSPTNTLLQALNYLQQEPEQSLVNCPPEEVLNWAVQYWRPSRLSNLKQLQYLKENEPGSAADN